MGSARRRCRFSCGLLGRRLLSPRGGQLGLGRIDSVDTVLAVRLRQYSYRPGRRGDLAVCFLLDLIVRIVDAVLGIYMSPGSRRCNLLALGLRHLLDLIVVYTADAVAVGATFFCRLRG